MCLSIFLAQVLGIYIFLMALAMLAHQTRFKTTMHDFLNNHSLIVFSGGLSLVFGLLIVLSHNIWVTMWPVLITIIGWILIVQGVMRIFWPEKFATCMRDMMAKSGYLIMTWVWLIVGVYLIWAGFTEFSA